METWQIRERGSNQIIKEFESDSYTVTVFGSIRAYYEHDHDHAVDVDFDYDEHYICRKGEVLVNEQELKKNGYFDRVSLKKSLLELREEHEKECEYSQRLKTENEALKAELAELKAQKEGIKLLGINDPSFEGACVRAEQKILNRAKVSEPEKEVDQIHEFYKGKIKALNDLHAKMNELISKSSQGNAIAYAAPIAALAMQIAQVSAQQFNQGV